MPQGVSYRKGGGACGVITSLLTCLSLGCHLVGLRLIFRSLVGMSCV